MTYADILILVAGILPYVAVGYSKAVSKETFDNSQPRKSGTYVGAALRAYNAQLNGFETFPFFAVAVIVAEFRSAPQMYVNLLASIYVFLRLLYMALYIQDKPTQRSICFGLSLLVAIALFFTPFFA